MSTMKQSMVTAGVVATVGATIVLGTVVNTVPANAALLDFEFTTENGTGSFTLNTSTIDSEPGQNGGLFQNAITDFEYSFFGISLSDPLNVSTFFSETPANSTFNLSFGELFQPIFDPNQTGFYLSLILEGNLGKDLPYNPTEYSLVLGNIAGYGGFAGPEPIGGSPNRPGFGFDSIQTLTVEAQSNPVPEPGTVLGLSLVGMWSLKRILSSLQRA